MRISVLWITLLLICAVPAWGQSNSLPIMSSVEPASGRPGDIMVARGANLGPENVTALYLTDGTIDIKVEMIEQTAVTVKFKIPAAVRPGRLALMVLTSGKEGRLIEEPVKITIEPETGV